MLAKALSPLVVNHGQVPGGQRRLELRFFCVPLLVRLYTVGRMYLGCCDEVIFPLRLQDRGDIDHPS